MLSACLLKRLGTLENALLEVKEKSEVTTLARFYRDKVFGSMSELRLNVDELETLTAKKHWQLSTYAQLLYSVN